MTSLFRRHFVWSILLAITGLSMDGNVASADAGIFRVFGESPNDYFCLPNEILRQMVKKTSPEPETTPPRKLSVPSFRTLTWRPPFPDVDNRYKGAIVTRQGQTIRLYSCKVLHRMHRSRHRRKRRKRQRKWVSDCSFLQSIFQDANAIQRAQYSSRNRQDR